MKKIVGIMCCAAVAAYGIFKMVHKNQKNEENYDEILEGEFEEMNQPERAFLFRKEKK